MQLEYAIEGYWLAKRRDFSPNTVNVYTLTFKRLTEFVGKTRELKDISSGDVNRFLCASCVSPALRSPRGSPST